MCNCNKRSASVTKKTITSSVKNIFSKPGSLKKTKSNASAEASGQTPEKIELFGETIADKCKTFAYMLGLDTPVTERVLIAALENPGYGRRLLASSENEKTLYDLLNNPPITNASSSHFSNGALLNKASKALMKWAISGFPTVPKDVLKKREDACLACPNLTEPSTMLQRFSAPSHQDTGIGSRTGNKICLSCGCVVRNKIRLATEACPERSAGGEDKNRWGE
jgi:hypothetical protein